MDSKLTRILKQLNNHLPWITMMLLITVQSSLTSELLSLKIPRGVDKIIHFLIFGLLGWLMIRGFDRGFKTLNMRFKYTLTACLVAVFGVLDELHQAMVPGRSPDFADWVADISGALFFSWLFVIKVRKGQPKTETTY